MTIFRRKMLISIFLVMMLFSFTMSISGEIPQEYVFEDDDNDAKFWNYSESDGSIEPETRVGNEFTELISVGYQILREQSVLIMSFTVLGEPLVEPEMFYTLTIELEQENIQFLRINVIYSSIGFGGSNNDTTLDISYQRPDGDLSNTQTLTTFVEETSVYWVIPNDPIDIIRVFDNPQILITTVRASLEYSLGGSSASGGGDFFQDELIVTEFNFEGGVNIRGDGFFESVDILVLSLYLGVPILLFVINRFRN